MGLLKRNKKKQDKIKEDIKSTLSEIFLKYKDELPPAFILMDIEEAAKEIYEDDAGYKGLIPPD